MTTKRDEWDIAKPIVTAFVDKHMSAYFNAVDLFEVAATAAKAGWDARDWDAGKAADAVREHRDVLFDKINSLEKKLALAVGALEFYADSKNYNKYGVALSMDEGLTAHPDPGKKAQETLARIADGSGGKHGG